MSTQTPKYTLGIIVEKLFPLSPELFIPIAIVFPVLAVFAKKFSWILVIPLGIWLVGFLALFEYPKRGDSPLEWTLAMIRFAIGALFAWFLWWLGQPWE